MRLPPLPYAITMLIRPTPRWYLVRLGDVHGKTYALAYDHTGIYLGVWYGKAIVQVPVPNGWHSAGGPEWQAVHVGQDGRLRFSFSFPARDPMHAVRNWEAQRGQ